MVCVSPQCSERARCIACTELPYGNAVWTKLLEILDQGFTNGCQ